MKTSELFLSAKFLKNFAPLGKEHMELEDIKKYGELRAIDFAKWIANYISKDEHGGEHTDNFQLIDGNYYWKDDEEGNNPLSEEQLYKMFLADNNTF